MAPERLEELWHQFTKSFIGASATVILGGIVAFVGGFFQKIDHIVDAQAAQSVQIKMLVVQIEERDKAVREAQRHGADKDSELNSRIDQFSEQHSTMLREIGRIKDAVDGKRR
jgi:hypothetical protein